MNIAGFQTRLALWFGSTAVKVGVGFVIGGFLSWTVAWNIQKYRMNEAKIVHEDLVAALNRANAEAELQARLNQLKADTYLADYNFNKRQSEQELDRVLKQLKTVASPERVCLSPPVVSVLDVQDAARRSRETKDPAPSKPAGSRPRNSTIGTGHFRPDPIIVSGIGLRVDPTPNAVSEAAMTEWKAKVTEQHIAQRKKIIQLGTQMKESGAFEFYEDR